MDPNARRFAPMVEPHLRTPYGRAVEKLRPSPVSAAVALSLGYRPPPVLLTLIELGGQDPHLVHVEVPV